MTLSTSHWVSVQDKGSDILCRKLGALEITPSDCLHQEYLTINLGTEAKSANSEALWEMEGQMLATRSSLWQRLQEEEQYAAT